MNADQPLHLLLDAEFANKLQTSRKKFWLSVKASVTHNDTVIVHKNIPDKYADNLCTGKIIVTDDLKELFVKTDEFHQVNKLIEGFTWFDFILTEWIDIYGAMFDEGEAEAANIDPNVKIKISKDIHRTFGLFSKSSNSNMLSSTYKIKSSEYFTSLEKVLCLASPIRGYTQGMNFLAAFFLLATANDAKKTYILLVYVLKHRYLDILYDPKCSSLQEYMKTFDKKLRRHNKKVYQTLKEKGFLNVCFSLEWFTTCFIVSAPKNLAPYILDLVFADIPDILLRVGLAIMNHLEDYIIKSSIDDLHMNFKKMVMNIDPLQVIPDALLINLGKSNILRVSYWSRIWKRFLVLFFTHYVRSNALRHRA